LHATGARRDERKFVARRVHGGEVLMKASSADLDHGMAYEPIQFELQATVLHPP
jgi:hypothetical protein